MNHIVAAVLAHIHRGAVIALAFAGIILTGALLLMLPWSQSGVREIRFIDALFAATSAISTTGIVTINLQADLSVLGQVIMIILIQIGGIGIMTIMTMIGIYAGKRIGLQERLLIQDSFNLHNPAGMVLLVKKIALFTFLIEFCAGTALACYFYPMMGGKGIYWGYWHAVSAFCNGGFDIMGSDPGFAVYAGNLFIAIVISVTSTLGGMGFIVIDDVLRKRSWHRLALHTRIVLLAGASFVTTGMFLIYFMEASNPGTLGPYSEDKKWIISFFMSVSSRMSGFSMLDIGSFRESTEAVITLFMFVGAAPVSTGGGIRTTTFVILLLASMQWVRGRQTLVIFHRRIDSFLILKSLSIFVLSAGWVFLAFVSLLWFDNMHYPADQILMELVSAFSTVGYSAGLAPAWNDTCKAIMIMTMFVGRVGMLTVVLSFARQRKDRIQYPAENVVVG